MGSRLEHPDGGQAPNDLARRGELPPAPPRANAAAATTGRQDWRTRQVREWLLLLLRFAITLDPDDQAAALRTAGEIDSLGVQRGPLAPSFFCRTTAAVCAAISAPEIGSERNAILTKHLARIEDPRLKRAFRAAIDLAGC